MDKGRRIIADYFEHIHPTREDMLIAADQMIAVFRFNGWHHKNDIAEGWVVWDKKYGLMHLFRTGSVEDGGDDKYTRPATIAEVLDGKGVRS